MSFYRLSFLFAGVAFVAACDFFKRDKGKEKEAKPAKSPTPVYGKDQFVLIPKGTFTMGSESGDGDEKPVHQVTLTRDYNLLAFGVPQKDYRRFAGATNREMPDIPDDLKGDNRPMVRVNWEEARAFCQWAGGDLQTEAQWERAAHGPGGNNEYPTGTGGPEGLHVSAESTVDVTSKTENQLVWGGKVLYHMGGNVREWVLDWYGYYPSDHVVDPAGAGKGWSRALRGGSWSSLREKARAANRDDVYPAYRDGSVGFRCAFPS